MQQSLKTPTPPRVAFKQAGFSLVEMMLVLVITMVIATAAVPALGSVMRKAQERQAQSDLRAAARLTQSEAMRRGQTVTLAPEGSCATATTEHFNWGCQWRVFVDTNANHAFDSGDELVRLYSAPDQVHISSNGGYVVYQPNGTTSNPQTITVGTAERTVLISWARIR
jgi:type II secretion system protein H